MSETLEFDVKVLHYMVVHAKTVVLVVPFVVVRDIGVNYYVWRRRSKPRRFFYFHVTSSSGTRMTWPRPEHAVLYPDVGALFLGRHHPIRWILSVPRDLYGETSPLRDVMRPEREEREICMLCTSRLLGQNNHKFLQVEEVEGSSLSRTSTPGPLSEHLIYWDPHWREGKMTENVGVHEVQYTMHQYFKTGTVSWCIVSYVNLFHVSEKRKMAAVSYLGYLQRVLIIFTFIIFHFY